MKKPITIKIIFPTNLVTKSGKIVLIVLPNHTDKAEMVRKLEEFNKLLSEFYTTNNK